MLKSDVMKEWTSPSLAVIHHVRLTFNIRVQENECAALTSISS